MAPPEAKAKVQALVERELKKHPGAKSKELQEKAAKVDKSVARLSGRQFHAIYALQARRKLFGRASGKSRRTKARASARRGREPLVEILTDSYKERKARLDEAIDRAFRRALEADSVQRVNSLLSSLERKAQEFDKI